MEEGIVCKKCNWNWTIEKNDENPFLCHKCGYDNKRLTFDYDALSKWKSGRENTIMNEIRKIVRESLSEVSGGDNSNYVTEEVSASYYADGDLPNGQTISGEKAYVEWNLDIDKRSWGIKSFNPSIVNINVELEIWSEDGQDFSTKTISLVENGKVIDGYHLKFYKNHEQDTIIPTSLEIDERRKEIEISFDYP